jgi:hypothetical protein
MSTAHKQKNQSMRLSATRAGDGVGVAAIEILIDDRLIGRDVCDLRSNDDRRRCANVIHELVPAASIESIERELLAIDPDALPSVDGADAPWSEPVAIDRVKVPTFPVDVLPEPLRSWVVSTAEACQVPVDLPGLLSLSICAGAVARRVEVIAGRDWFEPINVYAAVILDPANRKSAAFSAALKPLRAIERQLIEEASPTHAKLASARRIKEKALTNLEKKAGATGDGESIREAARLAEELSLEPIPSLPKLIVDDATAEAVEMQLAAQGGRLVVAGCEGGLFDVMAGRYSSGVGNLDIFLKGHAGDDLRVDRVTRSGAVDRCCLTLAYAVQPDVIRGMAERPSFRGRGLIGRFMYAIPESPIGRRRVNAEPVSGAVADAYDALVRRLAAIPDGPDGRPWYVGLSAGATSCFHDWQREVELMLGDTGRMVEFRDWGGKLCGLTARLAAIMHLVSIDDPEPWQTPIELSVVESAITLSRWAICHAEAVIGLMAGGDTPLDDAVYMLRWLRERGLGEFSRRDAQNHGRQRFDGEPKRLDYSLELLIERGWIRPLPMPLPSPGRPPSPRYLVCPELFGGKSEPTKRKRGAM